MQLSFWDIKFALFIGHGNIPRRGGPEIFNSLYQYWKFDKKMINKTGYREFAITTIKYIFVENEYFTDVFIAFLAKLKCRKTRIYGPAYHMPPFPNFKKNFIDSLIHYIDYRLGVLFMTFFYSGIYTENSYMKDLLNSFNLKPKIVVESPGISDAYIKPLETIKKFNKDIDFLFLTSFMKNKGVFDFLELMKKLAAENKELKFAMAGFADKYILNYINTFINENDIKNIEVYSNIEETLKYVLYSRSKFYILPSVEDGIPITFYEAWAFGDIVITYNLKTYVDIQDYIIPVDVEDVDKLIALSKASLKLYAILKVQYLERNYNYAISHSYQEGIQNIIERLIS